MTYSRSEQETSIVWDEEEKVAHIYTASPVSMRRLDRLCEEFPNEYKRIWVEGTEGQVVTAAKYETPSKRIMFSRPATEVQNAARRRNLSKINSKP